MPWLKIVLMSLIYVKSLTCDVFFVCNVMMQKNHYEQIIQKLFISYDEFSLVPPD